MWLYLCYFIVVFVLFCGVFFSHRCLTDMVQLCEGVQKVNAYYTQTIK